MFQWGACVVVVAALFACTGPKGEKGDQGAPGPIGASGAAGPKGETGDAGVTALDYQRITVVSPTGTAAESGAALLAAVNATEGTAEEPRVVFLEPGLYDVGTSTVTLNPYVTLQGSGQEATRIVSTAEDTGILMKGNSSLQELSYGLTTPPEEAEPAAIVCEGPASVRSIHVRMESSSGANRYPTGFRCVDGFQADAVTFDGKAVTGWMRAMTMRGNVTIRRSSLSVTGDHVVEGLRNEDGQTEWVDTQLVANGAEAAYGLVTYGPLDMRRGTLIMVGTSTQGLSLAGNTYIEHSTIDAKIGSYEVIEVGPDKPITVTILHSRLIGGVSQTVLARDANLFIAHSQLTGGSLWSGTCYGCYNGYFQNLKGIDKCP